MTNYKKGAEIMSQSVRFIPLLLLISCASVQSTPFDAGNGKQSFKLSCSEFNSSLDECKNKAKELCASDYKLVDHHTEVYPDAGDGFYMPSRHHLVVECQKT
jgi:hypothetical protein